VKEYIMSNVENKVATPEDEAMAAADREVLETKAKMLGVEFHPNLSSVKLAERIKEHLEKEQVTKVNTDKATVKTAKESGTPVAESENDYRLRMKREASQLVRVIVSCKNPAKKDHGGQIFSIGNSVVGNFTKYVPFENQEGWHVPQIILTLIKDCEYQHFYKDPKNPNITLSKRAKEFVVEILPPLTEEELHDLAQRQAMTKSVD
jgi:hypothetical protein